MKRTLPGLAALAFGATVLCSCGSVPTTRYYLLESADFRSGREAEGPGLAVGVNTFRVDPPYDQDGIVYRIGGDSHEVATYAYHRWAAPVARMLPMFVAGSLRGAPGVASIELREPEEEYSALLDGRVLAIEEIDDSEGQRVRIRLELTLRDAEGQVLWSETLRCDGRTRAESVDDVVREMSARLDESLVALRDDFGRAVATAAK